MSLSNFIKQLWCKWTDPKKELSHYVSKDKVCPICDRVNPKDHYHCGVCSKILLEVMLKDA